MLPQGYAPAYVTDVHQFDRPGENDSHKYSRLPSSMSQTFLPLMGINGTQAW